MTIYPFELRVCPHGRHRHQLRVELRYLYGYDPCHILPLISQGKDLSDKTSTTGAVIMVGKMYYVSITFIPFQRVIVTNRYYCRGTFYNVQPVFQLSKIYP